MLLSNLPKNLGAGAGMGTMNEGRSDRQILGNIDRTHIRQQQYFDCLESRSLCLASIEKSRKLLIFIFGQEFDISTEIMH